MSQKDEVYSKIYNDYYKRVFSFLHKLCRDYDTAADLTQETFFQAFRSFGSFSGKSDMFTWLAAIAKHCYYKYLRKSGRDYTYAGADYLVDMYFDRNDTDPETEYIKSEMKAAVQKTVKKLPSKYRDVIVLRIYADLSFKQVGEALGISENSAKVIYFRAKNKVKEELKNEYSL